jgi:hypothetical protein
MNDLRLLHDRFGIDYPDEVARGPSRCLYSPNCRQKLFDKSLWQTFRHTCLPDIVEV